MLFYCILPLSFTVSVEQRFILGKAVLTRAFEIVAVKLQKNSAEVGHKPPSVLVRNAF